MTSYQPLDIPLIPLEGTCLIEASAGTGKTFTISYLYLRLLLEKQLDVRSILVVTYTEAATKELIERIRSNLSAVYQACCQNKPIDNVLLARIIENSSKNQSLETIRSLLRRAIIRFDEASIYTIHGFCRRVLSDFAFETSVLFDTELVSDQQDLIQEIIDDFWRIHFSTQPPLLIETAQANNLGTTGLVTFANQVLRIPFARLIPEPEEEAPKRLLAELKTIREEWDRSGDDIRGIMRDDKGLQRSEATYRLDILETHFQVLQHLSQGEEPVQLLHTLTRFSQGVINQSIKKKHGPPTHPFFALCESFAHSIQKTVIWIKQTFIRYLKQELESRKRDANIQSFDDLLSIVHRSLISADRGEQLLSVIRKTYQVALIDEFQDTDPVQYDIFKTIFQSGGSLYFIGDPKQSIFSFRGADIYSYFRAVEEVEPENCFSLDTNWRSETGMVEAVNKLFASARNPFAMGEDLSFGPSQSTPESKGNREQLIIQEETPASLFLWFLRSQKQGKPQILNKDQAALQAMDAVTAEIARILDLSDKGLATLGGRPLKPSDMAVLVLKNKDAQALKEQLTRLNIPAVMTKSGNVFHSDEARELILVLRAVAAPFRASNLNTALATSLLGVTGEEILSYMEDNSRLDDYEEHGNRFVAYHELWNTQSFIHMFRKLLADYEVRKRILRLPNGERKLTNTLHLSELIHAEAVANDLGINRVISWLREQRQTSAENEAWELRLERDDQAVQISTVFKSKGLQYPIVFSPFMWQRSAIVSAGDKVYHDEKDLILDLGSDHCATSGTEQAQREMLSDLMRLLYVALTRSQNRCYLVCGRIGKKPANAVDYLLSGGSETDPVQVSQLCSQITAMDEDALLQFIRGHLGEDDSSLRFSDSVPVESISYQPEVGPSPLTLKSREYSDHNRWLREWGIASYSRIVAGEKYRHHTEEDLLLTDEAPDPVVMVADADEDSFFLFPKGRLAGTCIHSVFEKIDFTAPQPQDQRAIILQELNRFGLTDQTVPVESSVSNAERLHNMVTRVLNSPLRSAQDSFTLSCIEAKQKLVELEFHFPIAKLSADRLHQLLKQGSGNASPEGETLSQRISTLNFKPIYGYMHGFVDLVFEHDEKFYIVDWKSNHLGSSYADYQPEKLASTMSANLYDLQYIIYTIALHQYLKGRVPDFQYEKHFGGVFYLFVRGIHPELPGNGIFFDKPALDVVSRFEQIIR